jgi:hypothetical protein
MTVSDAITKVPGVPERLAALGELFADRDKVYGNSWKHNGAVIAAFFPDGLLLRSPEDFGRFSMALMLINKLQRYARNFSAGGHADSLDDLAVYAQMLQQLDHDHKQKDSK